VSSIIILYRSEKENLVVQLADGAWSRIAKILKVFLHGINHGWGAAYEKLAVGMSRVGKELFDMVFGDKANTTGPGSRGVIKHIVKSELVGVGLSQLVQFRPE